MRRWLAGVALAALAACGRDGANTVTVAPSLDAQPRLKLAETRTGAGSGAAPVTNTAAQPGLPPPMTPGFYRLHDIEGDWDGSIAVICYGHGEGTELLGERIAYTSEPYPCAPQVRTTSPEGWRYSQVCNLQQGRTTYAVNARREANGDYTVRLEARLDNGEAPPEDRPRSQRIRRVGACPEGWRPGDYLNLTSGPDSDGVYRAHRVLHTDDVGQTFEELPAYLRALLNR